MQHTSLVSLTTGENNQMHSHHKALHMYMQYNVCRVFANTSVPIYNQHLSNIYWARDHLTLICIMCSSFLCDTKHDVRTQHLVS